MRDYDEITQSIDEQGRRTYVPEIEVARKAPAVICSVASRTVRLRSAFKKIQEANPKTLTLREVETLLKNFIAPLPWEDELISGDVLKVDHAIEYYFQPNLF